MMKKHLFFFLLVSICSLLLVSCSKETNPITYDNHGIPRLKGHHLVAYVASREEVGNALLSSFCQETGCTYEFMRLSTEDILRRVSQEKNNPQADLVIGGTVDAHITMKNEKLSEPVISKNGSLIPLETKDEDGYWYGYEIEQLSIAINTDRWHDEIEPLGLPFPTKWDDLLHPIYKNQIVMSNPNYSGTAYTFILSLFETLGEKQAINYITRLHPNIAALTVNGYMPAQLVSSGEYLIGINFLGDQRKLREAGFPLISIVPEDTGLAVNALSKIKHAPNGLVADLFIDYSLSKQAAKVLERVSYGIPTVQQDKMNRLNMDVIQIHESMKWHDTIIKLWNKLRDTKQPQGE